MIDLENQGKTAMILAFDGKIIGIIAVADTFKEYSKEAVEMLHKMGKKVAIITGDNERVARRSPNKSELTGFWLKFCRKKNQRKLKNCSKKEMSWQWWATASMTRRLWRKPIWALP